MEHYYDEEQSSTLRISVVEQELRGNKFVFDTPSAVFSVGRIDQGSILLIENCKINDGERILDLGCGYGPIGIALGKSHKASEVIMVDVNKRAVIFSNKNIQKNKVKNAKAIYSDSFSKLEGEMFDVILLNPPQHAGREMCNILFQDSFHHLKKGGTLQIVARHNKGGKTFQEFIENIFGNSEILAKKSGFRIYSFKKE